MTLRVKKIQSEKRKDLWQLIPEQLDSYTSEISYDSFPKKKITSMLLSATAIIEQFAQIWLSLFTFPITGRGSGLTWHYYQLYRLISSNKSYDIWVLVRFITKIIRNYVIFVWGNLLFFFYNSKTRKFSKSENNHGSKIWSTTIPSCSYLKIIKTCQSFLFKDV